MCVFPPKGKKTAEERKKGKDNYCRERERERERISTKHTNLFDDTTTTTTKAELGRSFFRRASREAFFFLEKGKKRARGCPSFFFFFFFSFLIFGGRIPILSLSLSLSRGNHRRLFFRSRALSLFLSQNASADASHLLSNV